MPGPFELVIIVGIFGFGFLGYFLLQKDNHWCKVVGGTLTVLVILLIINLIFLGSILSAISSARY
jgi:hypothetical protein